MTGGCSTVSPSDRPSAVTGERPVDLLDLDELLLVAETALGARVPIRDIGLLASAVARPATTVFGDDAYPDLHTKVAALLTSIATNHPLVDGNKRLAWLAAVTTYQLNGFDLAAPEDDAYDLVIAVADGSTRDIPVIAAALAGWTTPLPAG